MFVDEFKKGTNPHGIPYAALTTGVRVVVDIPIDLDGTCAEVEGIISKELWQGAPNAVYSQINMVVQKTHRDEIMLGGGLYAIYPEKVKKIIG